MHLGIRACGAGATRGPELGPEEVLDLAASPAES